MRASSLRQRVDFPRAALAAMLLGSLAWRAPHLGEYLHDDTFISMRYARNLLRGQGLTFTQGDRVEGYTNFLWTILLAVLQRLHVDMAWAASCLSSLASVLLIGVVYRIGARQLHGAPRTLALVAPLFLALNPLLVAESLAGLETTFFVLLVCIGFERHLAARQGSRDAEASAAAFGIATLVRPEAALLFGLLQLTRLAGERRWRSVATACGVYALLVAPHLIFRAAYYGDLLPNTFYAKVGSSWEQVRRGARYAWEYGARVVSLPVLALALFGAWGGGWRQLALLLVVVQTAYVIAVGGDYMPTGRFMLVQMPFLALLLQSAVVDVHAALGGWRRVRIALPAVLALLSALSCYAAGSALLHSRGWPAVNSRSLAARRFMGLWLHDTQPRDTEVAVGSIGAIGYYSDLPILDTFGITNRAIGRKQVVWMGHTSPGHEKGDADYVLRRAPRIILFDRAFLKNRTMSLEEFAASAMSPTEHLLLEDPRFFAMYGLRTLPTSAGVLHYLERVPATGTP